MSGRDIVTVEGVGCAKQLHPVQRAMVENFGSQCGYCTPGFIMSMFEGYYRKDLKTAAQLDEQLCGNLCRCTGYRPIRDAVADALTSRNGSDQFRRTAQERQGETRRGALRTWRREIPATDFAPETLRHDGGESGGPPDRRRDRARSRNHQEIPKVSCPDFGRSDSGTDRRLRPRETNGRLAQPSRSRASTTR